MSSADGTCEPCDIFLRLPNFPGIANADKIMAGVVSTLPGVARAPWDKGSRRLKRWKPLYARASATDALVAYAEKMAPGSWEDAQAVRAKLGISHGTWFRVVADPAALDKVGVKVERAVGRRAARLVRSSS